MLPGSITSCACFCAYFGWKNFTSLTTFACNTIRNGKIESFIIALSNESQVAQMLDYLPQYMPLRPSKFHAQTLPLLSSPHPNPSPFPVSLDIDQEIC